mmetsp:Transcript_12006/g.39294  ORF Transcript_12006/g.39294 Transcript_12006/m.39294 type:complete len:137 (-) Transcript_12006:253-663(-)
MRLSPHKSPISATWPPFWTTRVPLSVPATLLETRNDARRRKDGRTAANARRSGQLRAKVVDLPIISLIFWAGSGHGTHFRDVRGASTFTFLGLLAKIKCSICSYQCENWYSWQCLEIIFTCIFTPRAVRVACDRHP